MATKIMVVDDEPDFKSFIRQAFRRRIKQKDMYFVFAENGFDALKKLQEEPDIDVVITDINMPEMDGLTLLTKLSELEHPTLKTIVISAYGDMDSIRNAMNLGAFDFLTKPINLHDLEITTSRTLNHVQQIKETLQEKFMARRAREELSKQIAHQESQQKYERRFRALIENSTDIILILNREGNIIYASPSALRVLDDLEWIVTADENCIIDKKFWDLIHGDELNNILQIFEKVKGEPGRKYSLGELQLRTYQQNWHIFEAIVTNLLEEESVQGIVVNCHNITERKLAEEKLLHDALHDGLTGLPNRILLMDRLSQAIARQKRDTQEKFAVLFIDLDRFKVINDSLGHWAGDELLIEVAIRLQKSMQYDDTVARLGGDEFVVLLGSVQTVEDAEMVAEKLQNELQRPFFVAQQEIYTSASIGIVFSDGQYDLPSDLLRDADTAMYQAKALGKARQEMFDVSKSGENLARLQMEMELRRALEREEFSVYYQPIVELATGQLSGFEALLRWHHPQKGMISPGRFIPLAEETGTIVPIGWWVMGQACQQMRKWLEEYNLGSGSGRTRPLVISINLAGRQFSQPRLVEQVEQILQTTGLGVHHLKLEITETTIMENEQTVMDTLSRLKKMNVQLSIDDFGTGYSSLSRLGRFPIDTLKIDRSFVMTMETEPENLEIVKAIINMADGLGLDVIAEGLETLEQLEKLYSLNCKYGQGYFFAKPLDLQHATQILADRHQWSWQDGAT